MKPIIRGHTSKGKTIITSPKFADRHIIFFEKYLEVTIRRNINHVIIFDTITKSKLQLAVKAYCYEFGGWDR